MAWQPVPREICERALRKINAFPITDTAADPEHLNEALYWLDMVLAELSGHARLWWWLTGTLSFALAASTQSYALKATLGSGYPAEGLLYPVECWYEDAAGNRTPLKIVRRDTFEERVKAGQTGDPAMVWIDRLGEPTLWVWPVPAATGKTLKLVYQTLSPQVAVQQPAGRPAQGNAPIDFPATWNLWAVTRLSAELGDGPIRSLPSSRIEAWRGQAERTKQMLLAFDNREHETEPPIIEHVDFL